MRQIRLQSNFIEIPLVDDKGEVVETFKFDKTDEGIANLEKQYKKVTEMAKSDENFESQAKRKAFMKIAVDGTFGAGSFDKLYKLNPSLTIVSAYYLQMCLAIKEDINDMVDKNDQVLNKYMEG